MSTIFVLDTFTRSGSLFSSAGETGATWTAFGTASTFTMDGTAVYHAANDGIRGAYPSGTPHNANYGVAVSFTFNPAVSASQQVRLFLRATNPGAGGDAAIEFDWRSSDGNLYMYAYDATDDVENDLGNIGPTTAGTHTLAVEVIGNAVVAKLNGVVVGTLNIATVTGLTAAGVPAFKVNDNLFGSGALSNTASLQLNSFEAYDVGGIEATDNSDTASATALVALLGSVAATDSADTASVAVTVTTSAPIDAIESSDTGLLVVDALIIATESGDVARVTASSTTSATIAATDSGDSASLTARNLGYIETTDSGDVSAINVTSNWASAALELSGYEIFGLSDSSHSTLGAHLTLSGYTLTASTGAVANLELSGYTLTAAGTAPNRGTAALRLSGYTVTGAATVNNLASAALELSGYTVQGYTGAVASLELSGYTLTGAAFAGNHATSSLALSGYTVAATGTVNNHATADLVLSGYGPVNQASAFLTLSGYTVTSLAAPSVTVEYEGYSATLMAEGPVAVTHYTNFPFKQFIRYQNQVYGVAVDGLYALTGDTDAGTAILSTVDLCPTNFANQKFSGHALKRPRSMYIYGTLGEDMQVSCKVDQDSERENEYAYSPVQTNPSAHRVQFGRGVKGQYLGFKFSNINGGDFSIDAIEPDVDVLTRTIWE